MLGSALSALASGLSAISKWLAAQARRAAEKVGAVKQREADQRVLLEEKDEQLRESAEHRPGDWRRAADDGSF